MEYNIEDLDISKRLNELGLKHPEKVTFMPENFDSAKTKGEFIFTDSMLDLRKIFDQDKSILIDPLGEDSELYRSRKSFDVYLPAIFFSLSQLAENSTIVSLSLNVLSNYVYDMCKNISVKKTAHVDLYIETKEKGVVKKVSYKGDSEGLKELEKIIKSIK